jgi:plasmid stabilization system protein ParE
MNLVWGAQALDDLDQIIAYIAERHGPAAERLHAAIEACAEGLCERPFLYPPGRVPGTREALVHPNYILIYEVGAEAVKVLAVVHSRQQYP